MRRFALTATAVAALAAGLQTPAFAATPDAPTDLTIGWAGEDIRVTWKDDNTRSVVYIEKEGEAPFIAMALPETGPNEALLKTYQFKESDKTRIIVKSEVGDVLSEGAESAWFDAHRPAVPALKDANLAANLTTTLSWTLAAPADSTPNDPLDVAGNGSVKAAVDLPGTATSSYTFATGTTSGVVPAQARPAAIRLNAWNEWGASALDAKIVRLGTLGAGTTVPASAVYGARLGIKSTLDLFTSEGREERASGIKVELQARAKTTDAWKTYGRYAGNTTTAFDTGIASLGNRQYRLFVPARKVVSGNVIALTPAASTSAKSSKTLIKFIDLRFTPAAAKTGTRVDITGKIQPAATVRGTLQYWTGSKWDPGFAVQFNKGSMLKHARAGVDKPGTYRHRIVLPAITVNGLTISATTSPTFNFTLR
ncbi:hypothetical protein GCM10029976_050540 [Kribbella albertanoniae]|uniref:DNRLRE domain-containing protein n=1 Tax=Kribbella albertanoniae TaxID=1266829 RepID=A0A4R4Q4T2_9ACTN|nr:hypothetical protein [Kribbella albertanoniae]TDC30126.1 hypothetical protein E1261_14175 [Kribbella albertanoniae]